MEIVLGIIGFIVVFFVYLGVQAKRAGPPQLSDMDLSRGIVIASATREEPGRGWSPLGSKTTARGLDLRFDHDDDPEAQATFLADPSVTKKGSSLALRNTVRLPAEFETFHVHTRGYVFRVRMRGTGPVVGKQVKIQMHVTDRGVPFGGQVENDDDTDAAVGGWIEFEKVELLEVRRR